MHIITVIVEMFSFLCLIQIISLCDGVGQTEMHQRQSELWANNFTASIVNSNMHRKAKYGLIHTVRNVSQIRKKGVPSSLHYRQTIRRFCQTKTALSHRLCKHLFGAKAQDHRSPYFYNKRTYKKRRILSVTKLKEVNTDPKQANVSDPRANSTHLLLTDTIEYKKFMEAVRKKFSQDPQRALLSISFLLIVFLAAMRVCGLRPIRHPRTGPADFEEDIHYLGIYEILQMKKPYLPKKILNWNRKIYRKLRKKKAKKKQDDFSVPLLGYDSENERSSARVYDF
ncbi:uncharacterized protein LOC128230013 [Mya arenaria]|uniref:uncharacterized protein LOC128230013 n=1 Tax=Mya arenaria TaxID=6604 RepID=UPI0022E87C37|nr:uncharacterized protein LOC128230013 [Mya arenaria]